MDIAEIINNQDYIKVVTAAFLGALIGFERELSGKDPSLRTFSLICLGSAAFSLTSLSMQATHGVPNEATRLQVDPGRIAAQIVVGIGFLGAGTIYRSRNGISGLTTAALMWVTAAIGTLVGFGHTGTAVAVTITSLSVTILLTAVHRFIGYLRGDSHPGNGHS